MALSNYDITRNQMRREFIKYEQTRMIEKFKLDFDEAYLYLEFVCRKYRVNRKNGVVEWSEDGFRSVEEADYNESMTIYDVLCYSGDECCLSGKFCPLHAVKGLTSTLSPGGNMFRKTADRFQGHKEQLEYSCSILGKPAEIVGDVTAVVQAFPFLPVVLQYWEGDEEFSPCLKFMYDENILDYMHFETVYFMTAHILRRLEEIADVYAEVKSNGGKE